MITKMSRADPCRARRPHPPVGDDRGSPPVDDRGSTTVEIALAVPVTVILLLLLIAAGRYATTLIEVHSTAGAASRAASLARTPAQGSLAAVRISTALTGCTIKSTHVDTSAFRPGGQVTVDMSCTIPTRELTGLALPGSVTVSSSSTSPVDTYRSVTAEP